MRKIIVDRDGETVESMGSATARGENKGGEQRLGI